MQLMLMKSLLSLKSNQKTHHKRLAQNLNLKQLPQLDHSTTPEFQLNGMIIKEPSRMERCAAAASAIALNLKLET
jgi:hypothetical protein